MQLHFRIERESTHIFWWEVGRGLLIAETIFSKKFQAYLTCQPWPWESGKYSCTSWTWVLSKNSMHTLNCWAIASAKRGGELQEEGDRVWRSQMNLIETMCPDTCALNLLFLFYGITECSESHTLCFFLDSSTLNSTFARALDTFFVVMYYFSCLIPSVKTQFYKLSLKCRQPFDILSKFALTNFLIRIPADTFLTDSKATLKITPLFCHEESTYFSHSCTFRDSRKPNHRGSKGICLIHHS